MDEERFNEAYLQWLFDRMEMQGYQELFDIMHSIRFRWVVPMDENRESDGRHMRRLFEDESGMEMPAGAIDYPASFMEVVAGLAETMEDTLLYRPGSDYNSATWFWMMLDNAFLSPCDDIWFKETRDAKRWVTKRIDDIMLRRYDRDGGGGFFPLKNPREDQRKVQLWYQMNAYVMAYHMA